MGNRVRRLEKRDVTIDEGAGSPRGLLMPQVDGGPFRYARRLPPAELAPWITHFWMVAWDLRGHDPYPVATLPHPNVHVVFGPEESTVSGVQTSRFTRLLEGKSLSFGIKFRPGGFRPVLGRPVATIANKTIPAARLSGSPAYEMQALAARAEDETPLVEVAVRWLRGVLPAAPDPAAIEADQIVSCILEDPAILTVDALAARTGAGKRSLQRLFREYVGASPKWVIRRYRLHEVVERLNAGQDQNWAETALELGYFDQAHLVNDFRSVTGYSPSHYQRRLKLGLPMVSR